MESRLCLTHVYNFDDTNFAFKFNDRQTSFCLSLILKNDGQKKFCEICSEHNVLDDPFQPCGNLPWTKLQIWPIWHFPNQTGWNRFSRTLFASSQGFIQTPVAGENLVFSSFLQNCIVGWKRKLPLRPEISLRFECVFAPIEGRGGQMQTADDWLSSISKTWPNIRLSSGLVKRDFSNFKHCSEFNQRGPVLR